MSSKDKVYTRLFRFFNKIKTVTSSCYFIEYKDATTGLGLQRINPPIKRPNEIFYTSIGVFPNPIEKANG